MSHIRIPPVLRDAVGGERSVAASGATVRDVRFRDGLDTPVGDDDTVILLPAMAGGTA